MHRDVVVQDQHCPRVTHIFGAHVGQAAGQQLDRFLALSQLPEHLRARRNRFEPVAAILQGVGAPHRLALIEQRVRLVEIAHGAFDCREIVPQTRAGGGVAHADPSVQSSLQQRFRTRHVGQFHVKFGKREHDGRGVGRLFPE